MRFAYPIRFSERGGLVRGVVLDVPGVAVLASSRRAARRAARPRLVAALRACVKEHCDLPLPTFARRTATVELPLLVGAKLALYQTMRDQKLSNVALASRLGTVEGTVRRLVDPDHRSHIDQVEAALAVLGKRLLLEVRAIR